MYMRTRPKAPEKIYRGGQFAVFTKTLDFLRLRNEIRKRSLVPRERNKLIIYIQVQISIASLKYNLSNVSKLSRLLEVSKEIQHRRRRRQQERHKLNNLDAWRKANGAASATPTFHLSIQRFSILHIYFKGAPTDPIAACFVNNVECKHDGVKAKQSQSSNLHFHATFFPALPLSLLKLPSSFF